ncbi:hypothetical protein A2U01_0085727 [Trifolium medium]|uniref:Uncharacterized protein n=1 Tax=Trifolium medium TaxID=97028 RepID=A0A392TU66_9FABA|nr:hypothetical protein [Trifolium medium]
MELLLIRKEGRAVKVFWGITRGNYVCAVGSRGGSQEDHPYWIQNNFTGELDTTL